MEQPKFRKGELVTGMGQFSYLINKGSWFYIVNKIVNPKFLVHMTYKTIQNLIKNKVLYVAVENKW